MQILKESAFIGQHCMKYFKGKTLSIQFTFIL